MRNFYEITSAQLSPNSITPTLRIFRRPECLPVLLWFASHGDNCLPIRGDILRAQMDAVA